MDQGLAIGKAAERSGVKVPTIRYYEEIGLLPALQRTDGNRRLYAKADVDRLAFIRHLLKVKLGQNNAMLSLFRCHKKCVFLSISTECILGIVQIPEHLFQVDFHLNKPLTYSIN